MREGLDIEDMTVSAVITGRNRPFFLREAIDSVIKQTKQCNEIIIIDDGSDVSLSYVLRDFVKENIKFIRFEKNMGANFCRNYGASLAKSDFIAFLDDDDIWLENKIEKQAKLCVNGGASCVVCSFLPSKSDKKYTGKIQKVLKSKLKKGNPYSGMSGCFIEKKLIQCIKFDNDLVCGQDWDLYVRITNENELFLFDDSPLYIYREHDETITHSAISQDTKQFEERLRSAEKHRHFLGTHYYKKRIAVQIVNKFCHKNNKLEWLKYLVTKVGPIYTAYYILLTYAKCIRDRIL